MINFRIGANTKAKSKQEEKTMAKAGMRRPDPKQPHGTESNKKQDFKKNDLPPVPELQGKVKSGKDKAR